MNIRNRKHSIYKALENRWLREMKRYYRTRIGTTGKMRKAAHKSKIWDREE